MRLSTEKRLIRFADWLADGKSQAEALRLTVSLSKAWKPATVQSEASRWASDPIVRARLAELRSAATDQSVLKLCDVLEETRRLMLSSPAGIMTKDGKVKLPHELDEATAAAIASFEIDDMGRIKYKFWDKNASLERAAKILGAFEKDNLQKPPQTTVQLIRMVPLSKKETKADHE